MIFVRNTTWASIAVSTCFDHNATSSMRPDAFSFSANGMTGPQGIGALVARRQPRGALIAVREQEKKRRRAGTENATMVAGLGEAARPPRLEIQRSGHHLECLRDVCETGPAGSEGGIVFDAATPRLTNTGFALPLYRGETLPAELNELVNRLPAVMPRAAV